MATNERSNDDFKEVLLRVGDQQVVLMLPADEEAVLNDAASGKTVDPYWGKLWDSAVGSARCILNSNLQPGMSALELGCGAGLVGIAALFAGLHVTFSDHEPRAVELAAANATLNGFDHFGKLVLDWAVPTNHKFDHILASDILYDQASHESILNLAEKMLIPNGKLLIGDPGRHLAKSFLDLASSAHWRIALFNKEFQPKLVPFNNEFVWMELSRNEP